MTSIILGQAMRKPVTWNPATDGRLLTVQGPTGIGKTLLAQQAASQWEGPVVYASRKHDWPSHDPTVNQTDYPVTMPANPLGLLICDDDPDPMDLPDDPDDWSGVMVLRQNPHGMPETGANVRFGFLHGYATLHRQDGTLVFFQTIH